ncbi:hypothetical protein AB0I39_16905 [Kitasatospora purpeofusca]|uniref:hypothetical protein n=1 Tax=Kitasatospora purpeofusca TaxID=67352 RepID=UPI003411CDE8
MVELTPTPRPKPTPSARRSGVISGKDLRAALVSMFEITSAQATNHIAHLTKTGRLRNVGGTKAGQARYCQEDVRALLVSARDAKATFRRSPMPKSDDSPEIERND